MHPILLAAAFSLSSAVPPTVQATCLDNRSPASTRAFCEQLGAAARLRGQQEHSPSRPVLAASGSAGKGALIGLGIGLGLGVLAALVVAPGCEENSGQCSLTFIVGGAGLGAGIGAAVGAIAGQD